MEVDRGDSLLERAGEVEQYSCNPTTGPIDACDEEVGWDTAQSSSLNVVSALGRSRTEELAHDEPMLGIPAAGCSIWDLSDMDCVGSLLPATRSLDGYEAEKRSRVVVEAW